jgi:hypothetical protein
MPNCAERKSLMGKQPPRGASLDEIARIKMARRLADINHAGDRAEAGELRRRARKRRCTAEIDGCAGRLSEEVIAARGFRIVRTSKNRNRPEYVSLPRVALSGRKVANLPNVKSRFHLRHGSAIVRPIGMPFAGQLAPRCNRTPFLESFAESKAGTPSIGSTTGHLE